MPDFERLSLRCYDAILAGLLHRCSALHSLSIFNLHLDSITINMTLLEELVLSATVWLQGVVIIAHRLKKLAFEPRAGVVDDFIFTLLCLAPEVEDLSWQCASYASHVRFGDIWSPGVVTMKTSEPQGQLQQSPRSNTLSLSICERQVVSQVSSPA
jgi:hypothetical protein